MLIGDALAADHPDRVERLAVAQNEQRKTRRLTVPVLAIGGAKAPVKGPGTR
jgi:hypothetical protein